MSPASRGWRPEAAGCRTEGRGTGGLSVASARCRRAPGAPALCRRPLAAGEEHCRLTRNQERLLETGPRPQGRTPDYFVEWLLNGPEGCSWKIAGFMLQVAGFSPFFSLER